MLRTGKQFISFLRKGRFARRWRAGFISRLYFENLSLIDRMDDV